jgi:hypothetical protein
MLHMLLEGQSQLLCTAQQILAVNPPCEGFVLHLFEHGAHIHLVQRAVWAYKRNGNDEAADFIAGKDGVFQSALAGDSCVVCMRAHRPHNHFGHTPRPQILHRPKRMLLQRWEPLIIQIMQESHDTPQLLIFAKEPCIVCHTGFHRQRMSAQILRLCPFTK